MVFTSASLALSPTQTLTIPSTLCSKWSNLAEVTICCERITRPQNQFSLVGHQRLHKSLTCPPLEQLGIIKKRKRNSVCHTPEAEKRQASEAYKGGRQYRHGLGVELVLAAAHNDSGVEEAVRIFLWSDGWVGVGVWFHASSNKLSEWRAW
jgi:hypothetical protein